MMDEGEAGGEKQPHHTDNIFEHLLSQKYFVDRTDFIQHLFEKFDQPDYPPFITAPNSFGKTCVLHMCKTFFELEIDDIGVRKKSEDTKNYKIFAKGYLNGTRQLKIFKTDFWNNHFGKYPVILLDLGGVNSSTYAGFITSFAKLMGDIFHQHQYVFSQDDELKKIFAGATKDTIIAASILATSCKKLTKFLAKRFATKSVVLIDGFDRPAMGLFTSDNSEGESICYFFSTFLAETLKSNKHVRAALMTGRSRVGCVCADEAHSITHFRFSQIKEIAPCFAFSKTDVADLIKRYESDFTIEQLEDYYGGYCVTNSTEKLFSTQAVIECLTQKKLGVHWKSAHGELDLIPTFRLDSFGGMVLHLISNKSPLKCILSPQFQLESLLKLKIFLRGVKKDPALFNVHENEEGNSLKQLFYDFGYFTTQEDRIQSHDLTIPNKEVELVLLELLWQAQILELGIANNLYLVRAFEDDVSETSFQRLVDSIQDMFKNILNEDLSESVVGGNLFIPLARAFAGSRLDCPVRGAADIFVPLGKTGILLAYKVQGNPKDTHDQIKKKAFYELLKKFQRQVLIGVSFNKRQKVFYAFYSVEAFDGANTVLNSGEITATKLKSTYC